MKKVVTKLVKKNKKDVNVRSVTFGINATNLKKIMKVKKDQKMKSLSAAIRFLIEQA